MQQLDDIMKALFELEPIKIWSLIMTALGDFEGESLTGKALRVYLDPLGIKPETTRVALHRLKKDGWVISKKSGREVAYGLSARGRRDTISVHDDVYGLEVKFPQGWQLFIAGEAPLETDAQFPIIKIDQNLVLMPKILTKNPHKFLELTIADHEIPLWFQSKFIKPETVEMAGRLNAHLAAYEAIEHKASTQQKRIFRLLFLHYWRKMILRPNSWAHISLLPDGELAKHHKAITHFLARTDKS